MNFLIEHQCPQCGAAAVLEETDRLFSCEYCRVKSFLLSRDYFRYHFSAKTAGSETLYFPYWRFKGMLFSCRPSGVQHRFVDVSHQALDSRYFPISVGLRSQALKLKFVTPDMQGRFMKPAQSFRKAIQRMEAALPQSADDPIRHQAFIGESLSIIYSPFHLRGKLTDAVLEEAVGAAPPTDEVQSWSHEQPRWPIQFVPALCPDCGWDLEGHRNALALVCRNCNSLWGGSKEGFVKLPFGQMGNGHTAALHLPFWRIQADITGIELKSYADLVRRANLPKAVQPDMETRPFVFWVQAFKVRPEIFLQLARSLTLHQPEDPVTDMLPEGDLYPITLPIGEAFESLQIHLAGFLRPRRRMIDRLEDLRLSPQKMSLVYIPFGETPHEWIHEGYRLALNKSMLEHAKNL